MVASKVAAGRVRVANGEITGVRAHIGIGGGQLDGPFIGASAVLGDALTLMAEYDTNDVNLGARPRTARRRGYDGFPWSGIELSNPSPFEGEVGPDQSGPGEGAGHGLLPSP